VLAVKDQLKIDFEYDDRLSGLALEFGIILAPHLAPGTTREAAAALTARLAKLAARRLRVDVEPREDVGCHTCGAPTKPGERVRVAVCVGCGLRGGSPGSGG
jgi:hypothetical protein